MKLWQEFIYLYSGPVFGGYTGYVAGCVYWAEPWVINMVFIITWGATYLGLKHLFLYFNSTDGDQDEEIS